jgi:hypothetical protein
MSYIALSAPLFNLPQIPNNMGRITQIFTAGLAAIGSVTASAVLDLKPDNFDGQYMGNQVV